MNILQFLFYLGTILLIFSFIWQWIFILPAAILLTAIKFGNGIKLVKILGTYLFVSLVAILTTTALKDNANVITLVLYPALGALMLFISFSRSVYERQQEARASMDWEEMSKIENDSTFDGIVIIGALILYFVSLLIPALSINPLTGWFWEVTDWALQLPVIGLLLGIVGLLVSINIAFQGIVVAGVLASETIKNLKERFLGKQPVKQTPQVLPESVEDMDTSNINEKFCLSCGTKVLISQKYCTHCGANLKG